MDGKSIPEGYLELCSLDALESLLLSRMNQSANLCSQMRELLHSWVQAEADVNVARWMLEHRRSEALRAGATPPPIAGASCEAMHAELHPPRRKLAQLPPPKSSRQLVSTEPALPMRLPRHCPSEAHARTSDAKSADSISVVAPPPAAAAIAAQLLLPIQRNFVNSSPRRSSAPDFSNEPQGAAGPVPISRLHSFHRKKSAASRTVPHASEQRLLLVAPQPRVISCGGRAGSSGVVPRPTGAFSRTKPHIGRAAIAGSRR